jgi:hypothetical protein
MERTNPNMTDDLRVTIRLLPDKREVYQNFKDNVINHYHSDICYVMTSLMEAFNEATQQTPNPNEPVTLKFLKQNVQINIGCNFNYNVKKARRIQHETELNVNKNVFFPALIEQWPTMTQANKQFWLQRLQQEGIIPNTNTKKFPIKKPCDKSHTILHAIKSFVNWLRGKLHRK